MTEFVSRVAIALDALLVAAIASDADRRSAGRKITATPFVWRDPKSIPTRNQTDVKSLIDDPVGAACRQAIRRLGQEVYDITGRTGALVDLAEQVASMDPKKYGYRASIIDHAWNGVGSGEDRWRC